VHDDLGDRMKRYEHVTRAYLPRRTYTIVRVDGRAFHTLTKGCERPYDENLADYMDLTAVALCKEMAGAQFAFVQSDEISVLLTDFASTHTEPWFGGNIQKICSISAAVATAAFNNYWWPAAPWQDFRGTAYFDSRVFTIPDPTEVHNYFVWRQKDATRNSISMAAQSHFSHAELQGLSSDALQEKMWVEKDVNWNNYPVGFKRGRLIRKVSYERVIPAVNGAPEKVVPSWRWASTEPDVFTASEQLKELIPSYS